MRSYVDIYCHKIGRWPIVLYFLYTSVMSDKYLTPPSEQSDIEYHIR